MAVLADGGAGLEPIPTAAKQRGDGGHEMGEIITKNCEFDDLNVSQSKKLPVSLEII
jgi:hypothetical protein